MSQPARPALANARRVIVKFGTRVLCDARGRPDEDHIAALVGVLCDISDEGREVILVTSGAIAAGMEALRLDSRPEDLAGLQMCASVGQGELMRRYSRLFGLRRKVVGQVLLTHDALSVRERHLRARDTLKALLAHGVIPIVNENDAVAVDEIKFGDNDQLAALVSLLVEADAVLLMTSVPGVLDSQGQRMPELARVDAASLALAWGKGSSLSTGGMASKLKAAQSAARGGAWVVVADGRRAETIASVLRGEDTGTLVGAAEHSAPKLTGRKRWIGFFHTCEGELYLDEGAVRALKTQGRSLLEVGVRSLDGDFPAGALVALRAPNEDLIGRGLTRRSSSEICASIEARGSSPGSRASVEGSELVIHRDELVLLADREANDDQNLRASQGEREEKE